MSGVDRLIQADDIRTKKKVKVKKHEKTFCLIQTKKLKKWSELKKLSQQTINTDDVPVDGLETGCVVLR